MRNVAMISVLILASCTSKTVAPSAPAKSASTPSDNSSGISVSGQCLKKVIQDRGAITVSNVVTLPTAREASDSAVEAHEKLKTEIKALALKDSAIETAGYSVSEIFDYAQPKRVSKGFQARLSTRIETSEVARIGEVIALASKHNAENVGGLEMFVSPEKLKVEREDCLAVATKNAADKASKIAAGAGVKLGRVIQVSETGDQGLGGGGGPRYLKSMAMAESSADSQAAPSIDARPTDLVVTVTARYGVE